MTAGSALFLAFALMQDASPPAADLSLAVACGERANEIELTIHNAGIADGAVLLGISLAGGRWYLPRELVVELTHPGTPQIETLVYQGTRAIAGRIDHWVVELPMNASFALRLRADDFIAPAAVPTARPEELRVRLTGRAITSDLSLDMAGMKDWHLWTGTAVSNTLRLSQCPR